MDNLNDAFWAKAAHLIPQEWLTEQFESIKNTLTNITKEKDKFILELKKIMS